MLTKTSFKMGVSYRLLHKWITKIDLQEFNILVDTPLEVRNFITSYTEYTSDIELFNRQEWWSTPETTLFLQKEDCDWLNLLCVSILYTLGYKVYLAIDGYDWFSFKKCWIT